MKTVADLWKRPDGLMDLQNPFDFSPVTYLDSIMNGKFFLSDRCRFDLNIS